MELKHDLTREDYDSLYHLLRKLSNSDDEKGKRAIEGIFYHLSYGPDYEKLLAYAGFYGVRFLLPEVLELITTRPNLLYSQESRIVDIGCGLGWLGAGIAGELNLSSVFIDKRTNSVLGTLSLPNKPSVYFADLETIEGMKILKGILMPGDLIVMCDFLHCIGNPEALLRMLAPWPKVILEYTGSGDASILSSYFRQLTRYGATAYSPEHLMHMVRLATEATPYLTVVGPYSMLRVRGKS